MITISHWLSVCDEFTFLVSLLLTCMIYDSSIPSTLPKFIHPYVTGTPVFYIKKKIEGRQSACQQNVTIIELGWCYCPLTKFWLFYKQGWDKRHQSQGRLLASPRTRAPHREGHSPSYQFKYIDLFIYLQGVAIYLCIDSLQWWQMCLQFTEQKENIYYLQQQERQHTEANWKGPVTDYRHTNAHRLRVCLCARVCTHCPSVPCVGAWLFGPHTPV